MKHLLLAISILVTLVSATAQSLFTPLKPVLSSENCTVEFDERRSRVHVLTRPGSSHVQMHFDEPTRVYFSFSGMSVNYSHKVLQIRVWGTSASGRVEPEIITSDFEYGIRVLDGILSFGDLRESLPVLFATPVTSITLQIEHSYESPEPISFRLRQLQQVRDVEVHPNPTNHCSKNVMIALDRSTSMHNDELQQINQLLLANLQALPDATPIRLQLLSTTSKTGMFFDQTLDPARPGSIGRLRSALAEEMYRDEEVKYRHPTNWEIAFRTALEQRPDLLVLIVDGWPNATSESLVLNAYGVQRLVDLANTLKSKGTRILVIGKRLAVSGVESHFLNLLTNGDESIYSNNQSIDPGTLLDYVIVEEFEEVTDDLLSRYIHCADLKRTDQVSLLAFPNPSDGVVRFELSHSELPDDMAFRVIDSQGREASDFRLRKIDDHLLELSSGTMSDGSYFLMVFGQNASYRSSFTIQR